MSEFVPVADVASMPEGHGRTVHVKGREFAIYNCGGEFFAIDNQCTHKGAPLGSGMLDGYKVVCPLHGWEFDVRTGTCLVREDRPVKSYPTRVRDGQIEICV